MSSYKTTNKISKAPTFKLITIGMTNVGKSSILLKFTRDEFSECISNTVGIDNLNKELLVGSRPVVLQLWDTAGQERFNAIVRSYYRGVDGFVFVFDASESRSYEYVVDKMDSTRKENKEVPFGIIVANKIDLVEDRLELEQRLDRLSSKTGYKHYMTSAKTGENISRMFEEYAAAIYEHKKNEKEQKEILDKISVTKKGGRRGCC
ncbi:RAB1A [Enterospora canceri]|uniref:RAB1A n=1 Tax=Enterospora canceri TaxID=1081671 RepID=A0A1Y1S8L9_9MICR|nr:RAB1A [Enterospora canceri]